MTARKKSEEQKPLRIGDKVRYKDTEYTVVYLFGSKDQYISIENVSERISVRTEAIERV